jgi:hypothetical protein
VVDVERVARFGAIDRDGDDVSVLRVVDGHGRVAYTEAGTRFQGRGRAARSSHRWRSSSCGSSRASPSG